MDTKLNWHKDADFTSQLKQYQGLTKQQLVAEKQKLEKKENVNYICVGNGYFNVVTKNIAIVPLLRIHSGKVANLKALQSVGIRPP